MDDTGPNTLLPQSPLPYGDEHEDLPPSSCAIQEVLLSCKKVADQRAFEAKALVGLITGILDHCCASNLHMSDKQRVFKHCYNELVELALKFFEA